MLINNTKSTLSTHLMELEEVQFYKGIFPYLENPLDEGLKYLGFHLKPNFYTKADWNWLLTKLDKRLKSWSFRWLSRAGRLILVKSVLEVIPVYWLSMTWIPKGTLEKIRELCFKFLWEGQKESFVVPWIKRDSLSLPKLFGGRGLKNIHSFSTSLAAKTGLWLISSNTLWSKVVFQKYTSPKSMVDLIRRPEKGHQNGSIMWKAMVKYFDVISQGLTWKVGKSSSLRLGRDS
jgi:hypothetical protein